MSDVNAATETLRSEMPASVTDAFDKSVARAKDAHEKMTEVMKHSADAFSESYTSANRGAVELRTLLLDAARQNSEMAFDLARDVVQVKSPAELLTLLTDHQRKVFEQFTAQASKLTTLGQKVVQETTGPVREGFAERLKLAS